MTTGASPEAGVPVTDADGPITTRGLIARYKGFSLAAAALLALLIAMLVADLVSSGPAAVADSTTCAEWSSASQSQQQAYGVLYEREHGAIAGRPGGAANVVVAVNRGCMQAFANDVEDSVNVVQAVGQ